MSVKMSLRIRGGTETASWLKRVSFQYPRFVASAMKAEATAVMNRSLPLVPRDLNRVAESNFIEVENPLRVTMGYRADHAIYTHEGYGPMRRMPPVENLRGWAERKLGDPRLAYVVARKKQAEGQKPLKYLEKPFLELRPGMERRVAARVGLMMARNRG